MAISLVPKSIASPEDEQQKMMQAMAANRRNANLPAPTLRREAGPMEQLGNMAMQRGMKKGLDTGEELVTEYGGKAIDYGKEALGFGTPTPGPLATATPSATQMTALQSAAPMASAPMAPAATMGVSPGAAQAVLGSGSAAAPAVANAAGMTGTQLAGTTAAQLAGTGAATGAAGAATGAATGGAMAALGTAMPWIGAGLLAGKAFGLFNEGGAVNYKNMGGMMGLGPLALKKMNEEGIKSGGLLGLAMMSAGGPVNKIEYKSDSGEVKVSYGGPLSNRE